MPKPKTSVKEIRSFIADTYGVPFAASLKPRQVFAVYNAMQRRKKEGIKYDPLEHEQYHQMNVFEWLMQLEEMKGEHIETFR